jgi:hypothetical protein
LAQKEFPGFFFSITNSLTPTKLQILSGGKVFTGVCIYDELEKLFPSTVVGKIFSFLVQSRKSVVLPEKTRQT